MKNTAGFLKISALVLISFGLLTAVDTYSQTIEEYKKEENPIANTWIGFSMGKYLVTSDRFQQIYRKEHLISGFELTRILFSRNQHNLGLSFEVKRFSKTGSSTYSHEKTKLTLWPFSISLRYLIRIKYFMPYFGIGADIYKYDEDSEIHSTSDFTDGFHIQGGSYFIIPWAESLNIKIFVKMTQAYTSENNISVDLGGFEWGFTVAFGFDLFREAMF